MVSELCLNILKTKPCHLWIWVLIGMEMNVVKLPCNKICKKNKNGIIKCHKCMEMIKTDFILLPIEWRWFKVASDSHVSLNIDIEFEIKFEFNWVVIFLCQNAMCSAYGMTLLNIVRNHMGSKTETMLTVKLQTFKKIFKKEETKRKAINESVTHHLKSLTHCVDCAADDDGGDVRDFHVNGDLLNVPWAMLLSLEYYLTHSDQSAVIDTVHSYRSHAKILHFARLSTRILAIIAMQLYRIQPILMIIFALIVLSFLWFITLCILNIYFGIDLVLFCTRTQLPKVSLIKAAVEFCLAFCIQYYSCIFNLMILCSLFPYIYWHYTKN